MGDAVEKNQAQRANSALPGPVGLLFSPHAGRLARSLAHAETSTSEAHVPNGSPGQAEADAIAEEHIVQEVAYRALAAAGVEVVTSAPVSAAGQPDFAGQQLAAWRAKGCGAVVAAGGDGTVGTAASLATQADLPLGILPLGTSNDVARSLGIPMDIPLAAQVIAQGHIVANDMGQALPVDQLRSPVAEPARWRLAVGWRSFWRALYQRFAQVESAGQQKDIADHQGYFLHALTLGLNVEFARLATDATQRQRWGAFTYAASAMEALQHARPVRLVLHINDYQRYPQNKRPALSTRGRSHVIECLALQLAIVNL
ncbi:MAG TPA: diacylglycerol kinase family protein, partial [Ktedonobacterales bacterium]|nr:diacylglycerol kinase family protein [Ktedonobacterales bacterium]